jgi:hypothetical protein
MERPSPSITPMDRRSVPLGPVHAQAPRNRGRLCALGRCTGSHLWDRGRHTAALRLPRISPAIQDAAVRHTRRDSPRPWFGQVVLRHNHGARVQQSWSRPRGVHPVDGHVPSRRHPRCAALDAQPRAVDALARGDVDSLTDFRVKSRGAAVAHPTSDHYVPLLFTVGAATEPASVVSALDRMVLGNSIRSVQMN